MYLFLKRLFEPVKENKVVSAKLVAESSLGAFWFDVLPLFTIPHFIDLINNKDYSGFQEYSLYIILILIVSWVIHMNLRKWDFYAKAMYLGWMERKYRKKIILKDSLTMDMLGTGKVQSILGKGMNTWIDTIWNIIYQVPKMLLTFISGFVLLKDFGAGFILLFLLMMSVSTVGFYFFRKIRLKFDEQVNKLEDEKSADSVRVIMSRNEVIFSGKEGYEVNRLAGYSDKCWNIWKKSLKYDFISDWFISGVSSLLPILGVLYIIYSGKIYQMETGYVVAFLYFASRFAFNMYSMLWMVRMSLDNYPKINNLFLFLDEVPQIKNYEKGKSFVHGEGRIEFRDVTFFYNKEVKYAFDKEEEEDIVEEKKPDTNTILRNFNLTIEGGQRIALVGKSGGGKTTIAKLASGYLSPISGKVLVDNQDITALSLKSYYKYIGYLTQEPQIFDGTILENMMYATSQNVAKEKIEAALRKAECDFVFKLKKGIHTQIGERGIRLSGGERQRLAIAKLFLKDPEIIILDEPTAALDSFSEEMITKSLGELFKNRTVIIIAHRLQTVRHVDRILVLEDGKIIEDGNHEELSSMNGKYSEMLALQSGVISDIIAG